MPEYDWAFWLGLAVLLGLIEVASLDLVFLMLSAGALAGAVVALGTDDLVVEALVALVTAIAMLAVVRPIAIRHLRTPLALRTGTAALIGQHGVATERIDRNDGRIKLKGEVWSARTYDPTCVIEAGQGVEVVQIDGATAIVYESEF
jgi:membrane protein implicated in regulation of membrane protease activity